MDEPLSPSPEIRYLLRDAHHVTCGGFNGRACTCLEWREARIAELAQREDDKRRAGWNDAIEAAATLAPDVRPFSLARDIRALAKGAQ